MTVAWQATLLGGDDVAIDPTFAGTARVALDHDAWVDHLPAWLGAPDDVMAELVRTAPWRESARPMYDRIVRVPRLTAWWRWDDGDPPEVLPVLDEIRAALTRRYDVEFTSCGCNLYRDGNDSVAWHGDRIPKEIERPNVAIVSVGEPRKLLLRPVGGGPSVRFDLGHGDLLVMGGTSQRTWQHSIPKVAAAGPRMSITFRHGMRSYPDGYRTAMAERDPHKEPENSTVDDWHGQEVDRMIEATEGDTTEAEERFIDEQDTQEEQRG